MLLVDDILDEGATLAAIEERYRRDGAAAIHKAVLVVKERARTHDVKVDFAGLRVPDRYIFGYGMDYQRVPAQRAGNFCRRHRKNDNCGYYRWQRPDEPQEPEDHASRGDAHAVWRTLGALGIR